MITIEREGNDFKMRFKQTPRDGFTVYAKSEDEIMVAIAHYYKCHSHFVEDCPICRKYGNRPSAPAIPDDLRALLDEMVASELAIDAAAPGPTPSDASAPDDLRRHLWHND